MIGITSLFTGLAFAGVIISVQLQKEELQAVKDEFEEQTKALESQQKEMVIQSFDNKFFQMLNLFNNLINSLHEKESSFYTNHQLMTGQTPEIEEKYFKREVLIRIRKKLEELTKSIDCIPIGNAVEEGFLREFKLFNSKYDTTFKFYFINLYQILKYIDKQFMNDCKSAKNYTNIVRAQLSKDELVLLFYNAIGVTPFSGENYRELVKRYAFFEHLTYDDLILNGNKDIVDFLLKQYELEVSNKDSTLIEKNKSLRENNS